MNSDNANNYAAPPCVTKKRYAELTKAVKDLLEDDIIYEKFINIFQDIFQYDPSKKSKSLKSLLKQKDEREKLKAEGISTYISAGIKKSYEKQKQKQKNFLLEQKK
jgi:hypothetical protein